MPCRTQIWENDTRSTYCTYVQYSIDHSYRPTDHTHHESSDRALHAPAPRMHIQIVFFLRIICNMLCWILNLAIIEAASAVRLTQIRVSESIVQPVARLDDSDVGLNDYMRLPACQYVAIRMPMSASLEALPGSTDRFRLSVPPVRFNVPGLPLVEARPTVFARVRTEPERVVIFSDECHLSGSPLVEKLRINERFNFSVATCFTWDSGSQRTSLVSVDATGRPSIFSSTTIEVDVDPPGPFALVPRWILEKVGNSVMALALSRLQTPFVANLAVDYERWATDEAYRIGRSALCKE